MPADSFSEFSPRPSVEPSVPSTNSPRLRMGDLITARAFPAVIHGGDVRALRFDDESDAQRAAQSHLIGLMALLADGIAHEDFKQTHSEFAPLLQAFYPRFVLHIALDEYDAGHFSLEDIFWKEVRAQWGQSGFLIEELHLPENAS